MLNGTNNTVTHKSQYYHHIVVELERMAMIRFAPDDGNLLRFVN